MSRLRIREIEIEDGAPEVYSAALASVFGLKTMSGMPAVQVLEGPKQLAAPAITENGNGTNTHRRRGRRPKKQRLLAPDGFGEKQTAAEEKPENPIRAQILQALKKCAMSSFELAQTLGIENRSIFKHCGNLKGEGLIETRFDDARDGVKRWFLK